MLASQALAADINQTRVLVLLTDGQEVSSDATLEQAIAAARAANVAVYPIGIESKSFRPAPLQRLAQKTGGRYAGRARAKDLKAVYAALASELRRTWQLSYFTSAGRPNGSRSQLPAPAEAVVPGLHHRIDSGGVEAAGPFFRSARLTSARRRCCPRSCVAALFTRLRAPLRVAPYAVAARPSRRTSAIAHGPARTVERAFADRVEPDADDGARLRPPRRLARASTGCSSGPTCLCHGRARLRRSRLRALRRNRLRGRWALPLRDRCSPGAGAAFPIGVVWVQGEERLERRSTSSCPTCW